jgi:hypothetical protein
MPCPSPLSWLDHFNFTLRRVHVMKLFIMQSLDLFSVEIFSSVPCSQTPSVYSSLNARDQVSHPYIITHYRYNTRGIERGTILAPFRNSVNSRTLIAVARKEVTAVPQFQCTQWWPSRPKDILQWRILNGLNFKSRYCWVTDIHNRK